MGSPRAVPIAPPWAAKIRTVGVTGTNGKTTTTAWIAAALGAVSKPVPRATTVGFFLDDRAIDITPDYDGFCAGMRAGYEQGATHAAIELTSEALLRGFARAWPCQVGVFTNLTHDHLDAHASPEHYLASKAQLFVSLPAGGAAVLNACDPSSELLREVLPEGVRCWSYGLGSRPAIMVPDLVASSVEVTWHETRVALEARDPASGFPPELSVRGVGEIYAENALAALLGAVAAGVSPADAAEALSHAAPPPGRFEVVHERPYVVVDYAHSPDALLRTLGAARLLAKGSRLFVVFGAGGRRDMAKRTSMGEAARIADSVLLTSDNPRDEDPADIARAIATGLVGHPDVRVELDRRRAIHRAIADAERDDVVVIAGKGHETTQSLGTSALPFSDRDVAHEVIAGRA